jgi:hypothetical protein
MRARIASLLTLAFVALGPGSALALWPDSGWYWNPAEPGRGVSIEVQDDKLFLAIYTYEPTGAPVYYYSGGAMTGDRTYTNTLFKTANGQCIGCSAGPPISTSVGPVTLTFTGYETATLTALGNTLTLQRFDFSDTNLFNPATLYGEWSTTEGEPSLGTYFGDKITLATSFSNSSGVWAGGNRTGNTARFAQGRCTTRDVCIIGLSFSASTDEYYLFNMAGFNRAEGLVQVVPAGAAPSAGAGFYFVMQRTKTGARVRTGAGPGMTKSLEDEATVEADAQRKRAYAERAPKALAEGALASPEAAALLQSMAARMAQMRAASAR